MTFLRLPVVVYAFVVDKLRRIPGAPLVERHVPLVVTALGLAALVALVLWGAQRSPQRLSLAELAAGGLSPMQTWIIVTGDLQSGVYTATERRYVMIDPAAPNAELIVTSDVDLPLGHVTLSGRLVGGQLGAPIGERWVGQLAADPVVAREQDPPLIAIGFLVVALLIAFSARISYPMFFSEKPKSTIPAPKTWKVNVTDDQPTSARRAQQGDLVFSRGEPVELRVPGQAAQMLRLHSAHTSVEVGALTWLSHSEPAILVRPASGDLSMTFSSREERDAAYAALVADVVRRTRAA
jgi:hypothetical protein